MTSEVTRTELTRSDFVGWGLALLTLVLVLKLHLLPALLAGLLVYELVHVLAPMLRVQAIGGDRAKIIAVALLTAVVVSLISAATIGSIGFFKNGSDNLPALLQKLAEAIEQSRERLPPWLIENLPSDAEELRAKVVDWLRQHAGTLQVAGTEVGRAAAHILLGMVVGALLSLREAAPIHSRRPVARMIAERASHFSSAFRRVVFAQAWISGINAILTWLYLGVVLPLAGVDLPLVKTMVAITFVVGLLPILGNLISNTVIVLVSLSYSLEMALVSLGYLVVIHKLEYFLNARIIGAHIQARAWELLLAMLFMEALFGVAGLIAAPIYYAYVKDELASRGLV